MTLTPAQSQWLAECEEISRQRVAAMREEAARILREMKQWPDIKHAPRPDDAQYDFDHEQDEGWSR